MKPVLTKTDYYRRWLNGEFGNLLRAWNTWEDLVDSEYRGRLTVRSKQPGQITRYNLSFDEAQKYILGREKYFSFNEPAPDDHLLIQGEVIELVGGLVLSYCCDKVSMREAMSRCKVATGLTAKLLLKQYGQGCEEWLYDLLDKYVDHVVEFGLYRVPFGTLNSRLIIWEVRSY